MSELKRICFVIVIAGCLLWPSPSIAEEEEIDPGTLVSVFGEADVPVNSGNFIRARKDAMNKALREAILNVVRMLLPPEDIPKEFRVPEPEDLPGEITELLDQLSLENFPEGEVGLGEIPIEESPEGEFLGGWPNEESPEGDVDAGDPLGAERSDGKLLDGELPNEEFPEGDADADGELSEGMLVIAEETAINEFLAEDEMLDPDDEFEVEVAVEEVETEKQVFVREYAETEILAHGIDFVQSYKFINEGVNEEETSYYMNVEFTFFISYLTKQLTEGGLVVSGGRGPKVILLVNESAIGRIQGPSFLLIPSATEENLMEAIRTQGYEVIPREEVRKLGNNERVEDAMKGNLDAVYWLKEKFKADYIIFAVAKSQSFPMRGKRPAYVYGEIDAKIYKGETLEVLWEKRIVKKLEGSSGTMSFQSVRMASEIFRKSVLDFLFNQEAP